MQCTRLVVFVFVVREPPALTVVRCPSLFTCVEIGEFLAKVGYFWGIVENDVGIVGMKAGVILVIGFGGIEGLERDNLGDDSAGEDFGLIELGDVGLGDSFLLVVGVEDRGAILRAGIGALPIEFGGIVSDGEEDAEKFSVGDLRRVVGNLDGLGVAGVAVADEFVLGGVGCAAGVSGGGADYAFDVLEHGLDSPEASARKNGGLPRLGSGQSVVGGGFGDSDGGVLSAAGNDSDEDQRQEQGGETR